MATLKDRKSVYGTDEIPHLWAHGIPDGRKIRNAHGNLYAEGDTLYSYGAHFPIARRVPGTLPGSSVSTTFYLYTTRRYSVTTRGHCYTAERAMSGNGRTFHLDPTDGEGRNLWDALTNRKHSARPVAEWFQSRIDECAKDAAAPRIRAATRARHMARAEGYRNEWREIHSAFRLRLSVDTVKVPASVDEVRAKYAAEFAALETERAERAERERAENERREREESERERVALTLIPAWRMGDNPRSKVEGSADITIGDVRYPVLRLIRETDGAEVVETSWGARVPADEARKALRILGRMIERGAGAAEPTEPIGHYRGMRLEPGTLRIGCHPIPLGEVSAFCAAAGWECPSIPNALALATA